MSLFEDDTSTLIASISKLATQKNARQSEFPNDTSSENIVTSHFPP
jgi:hypothetical protein